MIRDVQSFINYFEGIRRRTLNYIRTVPPDKLDWSPRQGEFTTRDILLHLAITEKMFAGAFSTGIWKYEEIHTDHKEDSLDQLVAYLEQTHGDTMNALRTVSDDELAKPRQALEKTVTLKAWRLLMMMVEHEIHHRSQLAVYLAAIGAQPPQIFGMGVEDVIARATG